MIAAPGRHLPRPLLAVIAAVGLATGLAHAQAPSPVPLTLEGALARALEGNRAIAVARLQRPVAAAETGIARERPNPDVTFEAERETPKQALTFSLPIELGGKRDRRIGVATAGVALADAELAVVIADVQNDVRHAYVTLAAAERRVALATDAEALWNRVHAAAKDRYDAGAAPLLEERQAQLDLLDASNDLTGARGEAAAARAELNVLLGDPPDAPLALAEGLASIPLPILGDVLAQARQGNAGLASLERQIAHQEAVRNLARAMKRSDLTVGAAVTWFAEPDFRVGYRASAGVTLPLFTTHTAGVVREDAELSRLRAQRDAMVSDITAAVIGALSRAAAARQQLILYDNQILPLILDVERMAQDDYAGGQHDILHLISALQGNKDKRQAGLKAALDYQLALADLERAMGTRLR